MTSTDSPIGTVTVERRDGEPVVVQADDHILVSSSFLTQYEGVDGDTLTLPGGYVYDLGDWTEGRRSRHAFLTSRGAA